MEIHTAREVSEALHKARRNDSIIIGRIVEANDNHFKIEYRGKVIKVHWLIDYAIINGKRIRMDKLEEEIRKLAGKVKEEGYGIRFDFGGMIIDLGKYKIGLIRRRETTMEYRMNVYLKTKERKGIRIVKFDIDFLKDEEKLIKAAEYFQYYRGVFWSYEEFEKSLRIAKIAKNIARRKEVTIKNGRQKIKIYNMFYNIGHVFVVGERYVALRRTAEVGRAIIERKKIHIRPQGVILYYKDVLDKLTNKHKKQVGETLVKLSSKYETAKDMLLSDKRLKHYAVELW